MKVLVYGQSFVLGERTCTRAAQRIQEVLAPFEEQVRHVVVRIEGQREGPEGQILCDVVVALQPFGGVSRRDTGPSADAAAERAASQIETAVAAELARRGDGGTFPPEAG